MKLTALEGLPKEFLYKNGKIKIWECPICHHHKFYEKDIHRPNPKFSCQACTVVFKNPYLFHAKSMVFTNPDKMGVGKR